MKMIYLAAVLGRYQDASEIGKVLGTVDNLKDIRFEFILVVKNAENIGWLAGPAAELKARLFQFRKIWDIRVRVLNEELAGKCGLT